MKLINILFRVFTLPFMFGIYSFFLIKMLLIFMSDWLFYGGEAVIYKKHDRVTLSQVYEILKNSTLKKF